MYLHLGADCMIKNTDIKLLIYRKMVSVQAVF